MIPANLREKAADVAKQLKTSRGVWEKNIGERLTRIAADGSSDTGRLIRQNLSLADFNHLQSRVNFLSTMVETWSAAPEPWANPVREDMERQLTEIRTQQAVILELVQLGWSSVGGA